jgi:hypothetical protein
MARFVRIGNNVVHIPSLANVSITTTCLGRPALCFYFHNQTHQQVSGIWKTYEDCERDLIRVKSAMMEIEKALVAVPLTEEPKPLAVEPKPLTIESPVPKMEAVNIVSQ